MKPKNKHTHKSSYRTKKEQEIQFKGAKGRTKSKYLILNALYSASQHFLANFLEFIMAFEVAVALQRKL
jgi:hypothetical protein